MDLSERCFIVMYRYCYYSFLSGPPGIPGAVELILGWLNKYIRCDRLFLDISGIFHAFLFGFFF